jgi:hypothetical protein
MEEHGPLSRETAYSLCGMYITPERAVNRYDRLCDKKLSLPEAVEWGKRRVIDEALCHLRWDGRAIREGPFGKSTWRISR